MNPKHEQILTQVAEEAFASMTFIFPAEDDDVPQWGATGSVSTTLDFSGPFQGTITLTVPKAMLPILAANVLGLESPSASVQAQQEDTLCELLNVISGNLLPKIASPSDVFHVHPPRLINAEDIPEISNQNELQACTSLLLDSGEAELKLYFRSPVTTTA